MLKQSKIVIWFLSVLKCFYALEEDNLMKDQVKSMVYLLDAKFKGEVNMLTLCGGVIINENYILAPTTCLTRSEYLYVVSGYINVVPNIYKNVCTNTTKRSIVAIFISKYYENNKGAVPFDIVIARVYPPYDFTQPASHGCDFQVQSLGFNHDPVNHAPGTYAVVFGWGIEKSTEPESTSFKMGYGVVKITENYFCKMERPHLVQDPMASYLICSKSPEAVTTTDVLVDTVFCETDQRAILLGYDNLNRDKLILLGIQFKSSDDTNCSIPLLYTSASSFAKFIDCVIANGGNPDFDCDSVVSELQVKRQLVNWNNYTDSSEYNNKGYYIGSSAPEVLSLRNLPNSNELHALVDPDDIAAKIMQKKFARRNEPLHPLYYRFRRLANTTVDLSQFDVRHVMNLANLHKVKGHRYLAHRLPHKRDYYYEIESKDNAEPQIRESHRVLHDKSKPISGKWVISLKQANDPTNFNVKTDSTSNWEILIGRNVSDKKSENFAEDYVKRADDKSIVLALPDDGALKKDIQPEKLDETRRAITSGTSGTDTDSMLSSPRFTYKTALGRRRTYNDKKYYNS